MKPSSLIRQSWENCHAALKWYAIPEPPTVAMLSDRVMYGFSRELVDRLDWLTSMKAFSRWDFVQNHGVTAKCGWRECTASDSMQIIVHTDCVEVDFDRWNPDYGAGPAFLHALECLMPGKTDPFAVARGLRARGIKVPDIKET